MKPLVLEWRQPFTDRLGNEWLVWGDTCVRPELADEYASMKRFMPSELAAEYWRAHGDESMITEGYHWVEMCGGWQVSEADAMERASTLRRFATLPHYDEAL